MHEVSIAQSILDIILKECEKINCKKINSVTIRVGRASGVVVDSLVFAFDIIKKDTIAEKAELLCEEVPLTAICVNCNKDFISDEEYILNCPYCGKSEFKVIGGRELDILEMDVEEQ